MNLDYKKHADERAGKGIPPLALNEDQTKELCRMIETAKNERAAELLDLLENRIPPGVDAASKVKADFLMDIANGKRECPVIDKKKAVELLGTMMGGYNVGYLVDLLDNDELAEMAAESLKNIVLVFDNFQTVAEKMKASNALAKAVVESWAAGEWFTKAPELPKSMKVKIYKVDGETNTDDLSPAKHAPTRPDIPLHALSMGETRFPDGNETIAKFRAEGHDVAFVGDVVGTGSSRKSATNSLIWHIGSDIPYVPNKRRGGVVIGSQIAPIFFNTFEDSGGLPIRCDVSKLQTGQEVTIDLEKSVILSAEGETLAEFKLSPATLGDEYRAGGRVPLIIGKKLTATAREELGLGKSGLFVEIPAPETKSGQGYTLAQKMVGRACGKEGVLPGETCSPLMTTVGSQDTTGPMTRDELKELACLSFQADLTMQSFCHTAAYPTNRDKAMHDTLPKFFTERGGVALRPGDGVVHSWLNRLILPDTVGTGGDSHTRFPLGISFPAGSGLVAFAAALGCMPLDMPESVLVKFSGELLPGITLRDAVNAIALIGVERGIVNRPAEGSKNIYNSRILEMEGLKGLKVEQAFELACASAERSAAASTIALDEESVAKYLGSNVALMKSMIADGYADADALKDRIAKAEEWLAAPSLMKRDENAEFAAEVEIDLAEVTEPVLCCPNNPDNVYKLSDAAGAEVDEVFVGSCMTNIGHFRALAKVLSQSPDGIKVKRLWITPPTRMDRDQLKKEGIIEIFEKAGARVEIPGCSLCMGNQARVEDKANVFSTSTRNFNNRMGAGAQVWLGSAELAAVVATTGRIPTPEEYLKVYNECIAPAKDEIYKYLNLAEG